MAYTMKLLSPYQGMKFIYNITGKVGLEEDNANFPTDVELVQHLIAQRLQVKPYRGLRSFSPPRVHGTMDEVTAMHVFCNGNPPGTMEDALCISPARNGQATYGESIWTIVWMNYKLFLHNRQAFDDLPSKVSPMLKQQLSKTTPF
jgi:hypothetical protein